MLKTFDIVKGKREGEKKDEGPFHVNKVKNHIQSEFKSGFCCRLRIK